MAEILAGRGIQNAFKELGIKAKRTYKMLHEPYYEVWDLDKRDIRTLNNCYEWTDEWGWFASSKGSNMGTAVEFFDINGQFMIGWATNDGKNEYDSLMGYFVDGLGVNDAGEICALAVDLGRVNSMSMGGLFKTYG